MGHRWLFEAIPGPGSRVRCKCIGCGIQEVVSGIAEIPKFIKNVPECPKKNKSKRRRTSPKQQTAAI